MGRSQAESPSQSVEKSIGLDLALQDARMAQGMRLDVLREQLDATVLRLEVLRLALSKVINERPEAKKFIDLQLPFAH